MKALSVRQPWAWLIVHGHKDIENRSWKPNIDVPSTIAIHASKTFDDNGYYWVQATFPDILLPAISEFERGGIVGTVEYHGSVSVSDGWYKNRWFTGPVGWILKNARLVEFIPFKGKLGLFEVEVPPVVQIAEATTHIFEGPTFCDGSLGWGYSEPEMKRHR